MPLLDLSADLLLLIGENLLVKDLSRFLRANRYLSCLLTPHLHKLALEDVGPLNALQWAAAHGHASLAELVLSKSPRKDEFKWGGKTPESPLIIAAAQNHPDVIRVLAKHGHRIDARDLMYNTPLHAAARRRSLQAIKVLLELGADKTLGDYWGKTPLYISANLGDIDCMRALIDASWGSNLLKEEGEVVVDASKLCEG